MSTPKTIHPYSVSYLHDVLECCGVRTICRNLDDLIALLRQQEFDDADISIFLDYARREGGVA